MTAPALQVDGQPIIDTTALAYYGNSQGGIMGGALTALAPDFTRSVLYVPGMNYSTLLTRSVDFADFAPFLYVSYPTERQRPLTVRPHAAHVGPRRAQRLRRPHDDRPAAGHAEPHAS